jgi:phosphatidylserine decarboxylase
VAGFGLITLILFAIADPLGWLGVILTLWCVYFFRDPDRTTPLRAGLLISPADGVALPIQRVPPPPELEMGNAPRTRISIFMNVFDVHVNRAPTAGRIVKTAYRGGKFFNASLDKASEHNERMALRLRPTDRDDGTDDDDQDIAVVQIAGLVARRIKCHVQEGQDLLAGERFGLIRFGSRVDVYLPDGVSPQIVAGQRCVAGETVLADLESDEGARVGAIR